MDTDGESSTSNTEIGFPQPSVAEMHVDFLLWEELQSNETFLRQFIAHCVKEDDFAELLGDVRRSVTTARGESDLQFVYRNKHGQRIAILIENKINAPLQPRQAQRYRERGADGVPERWESFRICLVAPDTYLSGVEGFDALLSLQSISEWINCGGDARRATFKRQMLQGAISKEGISGAKIIDDTVTRFREDYYALLRSEYPELQMNKPKASWSGESWFYLKHLSLPKGAWIHHKAPEGYVDLCFPDQEVKALRSLQNLLDHKHTIVQTGKSVSVRVSVSRVEMVADFASLSGKCREALKAAMDLVNVYVEKKNAFDEALKFRSI